MNRSTLLSAQAVARPDSLRTSADSTAAEFATVVRAGSLPVALTVTEVRAISPSTVLVPLASALGIGLLVGAVLGYWWRGRHRS